MIIKCLTAVIMICNLALTLSAQPPEIRQFRYIDCYSAEAVEQMLSYRIPASVILAQAIFESGSGNSALALRSNNHFGIKCHQWDGDTVVKSDDTENECFRKYSNIRESYTDHSLFLTTRPRYAHLFKLPLQDYKGWCHGLKEAGYATFPRYAEELIKIIEENRLYEFDRLPLLTALTPPLAEAQIRISALQPASAELAAFLEEGLLWLDEKDVVLRSLNLIIKDAEDDLFLVSEK